MRTVVVVVGHVLLEQPPEMALVQHVASSIVFKVKGPGVGLLRTEAMASN
jgi:hypothetical protein